jgi:UDP-3-O-[3-hydroxymyristoyl] glucosamine N-acyltransferase
VASSLTLAELAELVGGRILCGELTARFTGLSALDGAGTSDVSFLGNEKYYPQFLTTRAGAVLVPAGVEDGPSGAALVAVDNPTLAFSAVVSRFIEISRTRSFGIHPKAFVDPSAHLDPDKVSILPGAVIMAGATIGNGTEIGANCFIGENAVIGSDCLLMAGSVVRERCTLGHRVVLQPCAVIGSDGFGYELADGKHVKIDQVGIVEIGDDVEIGSNTTIDRARFGKTIIGEGTKIDNLVQIGHNCVIGKHCLIVSLTGISGSTKLGNYVTVAGQVGMVGHITIGDKAILSARTGVSTNLPGGEVYGGNPALPFKEHQKLGATLRRVPKLVERVKALEDALKEQSKPS